MNHFLKCLVFLLNKLFTDITNIEKPNTQGYYALEVTLFTSPVEMENVYILKNTDREEIKSLIENNGQ